MSQIAISVQDFRKRYGNHVAVDGISFTARRGEIFGLLGPNGAGKTTTLECLAGLRRPDGGKLEVLGVDPSRQPGRLHNLIGVQLQSGALPDDMPPGEAMRFFCAYHRVAPRYDLLERLGLGHKRNAPYRQLSTGLQRRLALALAIAHRPPVVILDEPTAGLDVGSRAELHTLMNELRGEGTAIILATHDMAEAEKMADRVAILLHGKIVVTGTPLDLTATGASFTKVSVRTVDSSLIQSDVDLPAVYQRQVKEEYVIFYSTDPSPTVSAILDHLRVQGDTLIDLRVERPTLEERFLAITVGGAG